MIAKALQVLRRSISFPGPPTWLQTLVTLASSNVLRMQKRYTSVPRSRCILSMRCEMRSALKGQGLSFPASRLARAEPSAIFRVFQPERKKKIPGDFTLRAHLCPVSRFTYIIHAAKLNNITLGASRFDIATSHLRLSLYSCRQDDSRTVIRVLNLILR